jgi:molybdopterin-guanine dinucleotide biosynthesis protein MobB
LRVYGIVGWKNSGKTTLVERLVTEITARGFSVSTIKHAHHTFDVDHEGKDSYRHRAAGAHEVLLASRNRWALMHETRDAEEPSLSGLLAKLSPVDLVLIEGYKRDDHAKVEAHRAETNQGLLAVEDASVTAVASDHVIDGLGVPQFDLDDIDNIASYILKEVGFE